MKVSGENGVNALRLAPNSSILVLDETAPLVWLVTADGAGYKTSTPYTIELFVPKKPEDVLGSVLDRLERLEKMIHESYAANVKQGEYGPDGASGAAGENG